MNRYQKIFATLKNEGRCGLTLYTTMGYPDTERSLEIVKIMLDAQVDMLELGLPFSDPVADGPVLQQASQQALDRGFRFFDGLRIIEEIRKINADIPIGVLTYANIINRQGPAKFFRTLSQAGADSVLAADVPLEESAHYHEKAREEGIHPVYLLSNLTEEKRRKAILAKTEAFVYYLARRGVTGTHLPPEKRIADSIRDLRRESDVPVCAGFGISSREDADMMYQAGANGVIIGSAAVKLIAEHQENLPRLKEELLKFVGRIRNN